MPIGTFELDTVDSLCYFRDNLCTGGGCELATIAQTRLSWKKFRQLLPHLSARCVSWCIRDRVYNSYVRSAILYGFECWPIRKEDLRRLERNERTMLCWMCHIKPGANTSTEDLREKLGLSDLSREIRYRRYIGLVMSCVAPKQSKGS